MTLRNEHLAVRAAAYGAIWFFAAFAIAFTANSLAIALGVYHSGATMVGLIAGVEGVVLFGPIWHTNRDRPVTAMLFAGATCAAIFYGFRMLTGFSTLYTMPLTKVVDASMPIVIGVGSVLAYLVLYRWLGLATGDRADLP